METQTASLVTMDAATSEDSVAAYAEDLLAGTGWQVDSVRRRGNRLEPPDSYWSLFKVGVSHINKDEEERDLRLVAKGALNPGLGKAGGAPRAPRRRQPQRPDQRNRLSDPVSRDAACVLVLSLRPHDAQPAARQRSGPHVQHPSGRRQPGRCPGGSSSPRNRARSLRARGGRHPSLHD